VAQIAIPPASASDFTIPEGLKSTSAPQSLIVVADGSPGDVLSEVQTLPAIGYAGQVATVLPWKDLQQLYNGGEHPWELSPSQSATLLLFNPSRDTANRAVRVTIFTEYDTWSKNVPVGPLTTKAISLDDIMQQQKKDDHGHTLSKNSTHGIITWYTLAAPRIFGKLLQVDVSGVDRNYACSNYMALCNMTLSNQVVVPLGGDASDYPTYSACETNGADCNCISSCTASGDQVVSASYWIGDSSIATISGSDTWYVTYHGQSPGGTSVIASAMDINGCTAPMDWVVSM